MNKDQDTAAFNACESADLTEHNGFARAGGHDQQGSGVVGQCASELRDGQLLIGTQCHRGLHDLR